MKQRLLVAGVGLPALIAVLVLCPAWATMLLVCGIAGAAAWELLHTACKNAAKNDCISAVIFAVAIVISRYLDQMNGGKVFAFGTRDITAVAFIGWLCVMSLFREAVRRYGTERPLAFSAVAVSIVGGIVFPLLYSCIMLLRMHEFGKIYVLAPFFIAFAGDSLSMGFGMWFGKRKMAPNVSPKKTWAGFVGGLLGAAIAMCLLGVIGARCVSYAPNYLALITVGASANLFGQLGDLSMSLIKREAGIKDYSHLFLTHGGMLDRFDSTMFIAPVVYFFVSAGII